MSELSLPAAPALASERASPALLPLGAALGAFALLYAAPLAALAGDWWSDPDAGHGLLLAPLAVWLAWRRGRAPGARPQPVLGSLLLVGAVSLAALARLAAEVFSLRVSLLAAAAGLTIAFLGVRQLLHGWLPATLLALSIPLPAVVLGSLALPLQLVASEIGAKLLEWRQVPVLLSGNVLLLPGRSLFVTEACSGLRSLTALIALGLLIGAWWLRPWPLRLLLVCLTIPVAILVNGVRVFLTGFLVFYVDPALGDDVMHLTEGWLLFLMAFAILFGAALALERLQGLVRGRGVPA